MKYLSKTFRSTLSSSSNEIIDYFPYSVSHKSGDGIIRAYALCIGPTDYPGDNDLAYSDDDAYSWAQYLGHHGYNVTCIVGYVDSQTLVSAIKKLLEIEDADDYVAFIYSGHGGRIYNPHTGKYVSVIWLSDGKYITQNFFAKVNSLLDSNHVFWFFAACQIGGMKILATPGRYVALASDEEHDTFECRKFKHEIFTYYFLVERLMSNTTDPKDDGYWAEKAFELARDDCKEWDVYPVEADGDPDKPFYIWDENIQGRDNIIGGVNSPANPSETPIITPYCIKMDLVPAKNVNMEKYQITISTNFIMILFLEIKKFRYNLRDLRFFCSFGSE